MPKQEEIFDVIKAHLVGRGIEQDKIAADAELLGDLDLDSLDTMELTLAMEEHFGIEIPDEDLEGLSTIRDAVSLIEKKLAVSA
jgi:acyl carrier protein